MEFNHYSVLLAETIEQLHVRPEGTYVDGTLGGGGHAYEVLIRMTRLWKLPENGWSPSGIK